MTTRPCLPDFMIGGAPRAGTTFVCHLLDRHPAVHVAKPYVPEVKVFMGAEAAAAEYQARYAALFAEARPGQRLGEKTSYYLENEDALDRIRRIVPEVRMIFLVREPAARAYSNYLWTRKNGLEPLSFAEAIRLDGARPSPLPPERAYARPYDYLRRGEYDVFARRWLDALGPARVAFYLYEELIGRPERVVPTMQRFIGVEPRPLDDASIGIINSAREMGPPLDPALALILKRRFSDSVHRFAALTGLDVSCWGYDHVPA